MICVIRVLPRPNIRFSWHVWADRATHEQLLTDNGLRLRGRLSGKPLLRTA